MPVCDGATCSREIPWRMTVSALQMRAGNVPFSVDAIYAALRAELVAAGCWNISPNKRAVVFRSFCKTCWDRQAAVWGDVGTYAAARAKTVPEAIFMQVGCPDYQVNGAYDKQAIISCAVHELMHYWSYAGTGLQAYNRRANVDWDEAVADVLGFRAYKRAYSGVAGFANYVTPYKTYCNALTRAGDGFASVFGRLWREAQDRERLPRVIATFIAEGKARPAAQLASVRDGARQRMVKVLGEYLFTWFFNGPHSTIADGNAFVRIDRFLDNANLSNMFAVSNAFQPYDGRNSMHAI